MNDPWYKEGLRFRCTECGKCCTGAPGYVWLSEEDITALCAHLEISRSEFLRKYTRQVFSRIALREDAKNYDCIFLKDNKCTVYISRPKQCRTFPWWKEQLSSKEAWEEAKRGCEGIDSEGAPLIHVGQIQEHLH